MVDLDAPPETLGASAPNLVDITVDGKQIKAVAVVSKVAMTYVFDRATGEHVWPIVEAPVNYHSQIPGEKLSRTQPFTTRPPPFETLGIDYDDLIDFTPELRAEALEVIRDYVIGPVFTPPIVHGGDGKRAYVQNPGPGGGANWTGASFDPETNILYVPSLTRPGPARHAAPGRRRYRRRRPGDQDSRRLDRTDRRRTRRPLRQRQLPRRLRQGDR